MVKHLGLCRLSLMGFLVLGFLTLRKSFLDMDSMSFLFSKALFYLLFLIDKLMPFSCGRVVEYPRGVVLSWVVLGVVGDMGFWIIDLMMFRWLGWVGEVELVVFVCLVNLDGLAEVDHFIMSAFDYVKQCLWG